MWRERALKVVLVVVGLIFCGLAYPLIMFVKQAPCAGNAVQRVRHPRHLLALCVP
jgi:hypothetical protein